MWMNIIWAIGAIAITAAVVVVLSSIFTRGLDDVDIRGPRRRFPK